MEWYTIAFGVFGGVGGLIVVLASAREVWRRTLGRHRSARRKVEALSTSVTEEWFRAILGPPAMARRAETLTEKVWVDPLFYVQAIVDDVDQVVQWSVTSRNLKFRPVFGGKHRRPFTVQLHRTTFSELEMGNEVGATHGARRAGYWERHYWGNPGAYQNFMFAVTDAGPSVSHEALYGLVRTVDALEGGPPLPVVFDMKERALITPNTYGETQPSGEWHSAFSIGADLDHVRVVP